MAPHSSQRKDGFDGRADALGREGTRRRYDAAGTVAACGGYSPPESVPAAGGEV